jgi:mannose-1-phosphate guanylyltransferase/phosphomannomutase
VKAVIMAGGEGTRLRPLTSNQPKPMMPLANRPMMEHIVQLLARHGFDDIVVTVAFLANHIRSYFGDGSEFGVRMSYATEETPLGTAGSVRNAMAELSDEPFLVISGDVLTDIDLSRVVEFHERRRALATIGLTAVENPLEFGIVITREDGAIERFLEKPGWGQVFSDTVNNGIFVLEPEIFDYIEADRSVDFSSEVFPRLLEEGRPIYGFVTEGYWEDVGTLEAYLRVHKDVLDRKVALDVPGFRVDRGIWLGEGVEIDPEAEVTGPTLIGDHCRVEAGARLGPYTVLGDNVMVRADASIERSVIHDGAYLGAGTRLLGTVVGRNGDLRAGVRCEENVVLGEECFIGEQAAIGANVKIYPYKTVEAGAVVNQSLVWESKGARTIFGPDGVAGLANVDITPELATRLAMAWATTLKKGSTVTTSRDSSRSARMLKRALMAGLNAGGVNVDDLEVSPVPVTRFQVRSDQSVGGVTVRIVAGDPQSVIMRFFDEGGADLNEVAARKIERTFHREDFRRVFPGDIGDIGFPPRTVEHYTAELMSAVDVAAVRGAAFKVVVDYAYGSSAFVMPNVLAKLGADVLAVNPYASTQGALDFDRTTHVSSVADLVRSSSAQLGVVLDPDAERASFVDDTGHVLTDMEALLAFVTLLGGAGRTGPVAVPVMAPSEVDGAFAFPRFLPAFDAMAALVTMLELLARAGTRLSTVVAGLRPTHVAHELVATPSEQKGAVMRGVVEQADGEVVLVDGVKILCGDGWTLAVPDPELSATHVWAEAPSEAAARERAHLEAERVRRLVH